MHTGVARRAPGLQLPSTALGRRGYDLIIQFRWSQRQKKNYEIYECTEFGHVDPMENVSRTQVPAGIRMALYQRKQGLFFFAYTHEGRVRCAGECTCSCSRDWAFEVDLTRNLPCQNETRSSRLLRNGPNRPKI